MKKTLVILLLTCLGITSCKAPFSPSKQHQFIKIASYNLLYGLSLLKTVPRQVQEEKVTHWLRKEQPDVIAYQELWKYDESSLQSFGESYGHHYSLFFKRGNKNTPMPIGLTSKYPISLETTNNTYQGFMIAKLDHLPIYFIVVHLKSQDSRIRKKESAIILDYYHRLRTKGSHVVILGDFNSMSRADKDYVDTNIKERLNIRIERNKCKHELNENCNDWDYSVMDEYLAPEHELIDIIHNYSSKSAYQARRMWGTFPSKRVQLVSNDEERSNHLHRIDYILMDENLASSTVSAKIIHEHRTSNTYFEMDEISDHYPITATIKLNINQ